MDYSTLGNKNRSRTPHATRVRNKSGLIALRIAMAVVLIGGFAAAGAAMGLYLGIIRNAPTLDIGGIDTSSVIRTSIIVNAHTGEEMERLHAGHNFEFVPIEQIPLHVRQAFVAIEDERFYEHNGIDLRSIGRAVHVVMTQGGVQGASTITQQLIKNMLGRFDSDLVTKLQEQYLAVIFERQLTESFQALGYEDPRERTKDFILESYLNIINLGRQNYGVQAAAWFYFGVDVSELSVAQGAVIASITQNPSRFPPDIRPASNWERTQLVLGNMLRLGFIDEEQFEYAMREEELEDGTMLGLVYQTIFRVEGGNTRPLLSPFDCFTDALLDQVTEDMMREFNLTRDMAQQRIFTGGLTIYATQDRGIQDIVDRAFLDDSHWPGVGQGFSVEVEYHITIRNTITGLRSHHQHMHTANSFTAAEEYIHNLQNQLLTTHDVIEAERLFLIPQPQGAFVLLDHHTGQVLALRGIRGEKEGNRVFNRATQAQRQPGSQLKPLVFVPAFDLGIMQPSTVIDDIPFTHIAPGAPPWSPGNWWGSAFEGLSTARRAIYRSMNVVSARVIADPSIPHVGIQTFKTYLERLGIMTVHEMDGAAIILGGMTNGVRLIELTGAYGALANGGYLHRPVLYTKVVDHEGRVILDNRVQPTQVMRATTAYLIIDSMKDTMTSPQGTGSSANFLSAELRRSIPTAGKTGTSQLNRDLGFTGSTPYFTAGIWMGNDGNHGMPRGLSTVHTRIWGHIMEEVHRYLPPRDFERPEAIRTATVCLDSGHLATDLCRIDPRGNRARSEIFAAGHVPTQSCQVHQQFTFCSEHGMLAGPYCPPETIVTRVGIVRTQPIDHFTESIRDRGIEFPIGVREGLICDIHTTNLNVDDLYNDYNNDDDDLWNWLNPPGQTNPFDNFDPNADPPYDLPPADLPPEEPYLPELPPVVEPDDEDEDNSTWIFG